MKISNNFFLSEFIDPVTYKEFGESSLWFIDRKVVVVCQFIRDRFNKEVTVNNWYDNGQYKNSGFRRPDEKEGGFLSQHKYGRAADVKIFSLPNNGADEIRDDIMKNFVLYNSLGLTTIEDANFAKNWCHFDTRWTNLTTLFVVKPKT